MEYWEDVVKPTFKDVKKLVVWQRPFGYIFVIVILPVFYVAYLIGFLGGRE